MKKKETKDTTQHVWKDSWRKEYKGTACAFECMCVARACFSILFHFINPHRCVVECRPLLLLFWPYVDLFFAAQANGCCSRVCQCVCMQACACMLPSIRMWSYVSNDDRCWRMVWCSRINANEMGTTVERFVFVLSMRSTHNAIAAHNTHNHSLVPGIRSTSC